MDTIRNLIGGAFVDPAKGEWLDTVDPAVGRPYARLPSSGEEDVAGAVAAATAAFGGWSTTTAEVRSRMLLDIAARIEADLERFALAECIDTGKPISVARAVDIPRAVANFRFFATAILHTKSELHATDHVALNYTLRRPRGVAGLISPWNLPLYLLSWKVAPAIAAGNTAVAKPSEVTPMTAYLLSEVCVEAGLPAGVLNVVHGTGPDVGAALVDHPGVGTLSFTGGTATGRAIARSGAPRFKKMALEMGGKNPNIVFDDADMEAALGTGVRAAFSNQGQICLCGSRIFVQRAVYASFVERFVERVAALRVGDPLDPGTEQGAVVSRAHLEKITAYIRLAREEGGTIRTGGSRPSGIDKRCKDGYFVSPTVVTGLDVGCRVNREEIFGPVVTITPFDDEDEVVAYANATTYGLAASVWTRDVGRAHRVAERIDCGTVWINCWMLRDLRVPFGGMKESGVGREGGEEALRFFTEPKNVCIHLDP